MSPVFYSWKFDDRKNRSQLWYIIALSIVIGLAIWGFLTKQYGMSFIILFISGLVFYVENNSDDEIEVKISDQGLYIGSTFYNYSNIQKYTVCYSNNSAYQLRLHIAKSGIAILDLKITDELLPEIQKYLNEYVEDGGKAELSSTDKLIRYLNL